MGENLTIAAQQTLTRSKVYWSDDKTVPTVETSHTLYQDVGDGLEAVCRVWRQPNRCNADDVWSTREIFFGRI